MTFFLQLVIAGISQGMIYALIAVGFVIILKCSAAFNIAQGHFVMLGGYLGFTFLVTYNWPIWLSIILAIIIAVAMGLVIERLAIRPLLGQPVLAVVMMTVPWPMLSAVPPPCSGAVISNQHIPECCREFP